MSAPERDAGQAAALLRERARALAQPPAPVRAADALEVLEFGLADERYALPASGIDAVMAFKQLTPLPGTPAFMLGIVNVRGRMIAVIDIRKFFELPERGITDLHHIIVVRGRGLEVGLLADVVVGLRSVALASLQPSLPTLHGIRSDYLMGVTGERLIVLDLDRLLADPAIVVDDAET